MDSKYTILAIDNNNVNLVMLKAMLSERYDVETLSEPAKAVETAIGLMPDLILLDTYMPGQDGLSICREIRQKPETSGIPIIIISGQNEAQDKINGLEAGADDYITKPMNTQELKLRIQRRIQSGKNILQGKVNLLEREISSYYKYSANGITTIGPNMELRRYNRRFLEIFSINSRENHSGKPIGSLISGEPLASIEDLIMKVGKPPIFETGHITLSKDDGTSIFIEATATRISAEESSGILLVFTDVTTLQNIHGAILGATVEAEERERSKIAQELHDGIGATLSSINIYLNMILSGGADVDEMFRNLRLTKQLVAQSIDSVKEIANNLHPVILTRFGLVATVANMIEGLEQSRLIQFTFNHDGYTDIRDKNMELSLYRIINELINNTLKYAEAKHVTLTLDRGPGNVWLQYSDDGKGFDPKTNTAPKESGRGIRNIYVRVKGMNGICNLTSQPGCGMSVDMDFPYSETDGEQ